MSTTAFELRTDVQMPGARNRYPFDSMPSGSMFEIEGEDEARKVRNAAYQYAKKVNRNAAIKAAEKELGRKLTSDEKAAVSPLGKGDEGAVEFALRQVRVEGEGESAVKVYGLWRVA